MILQAADSLMPAATRRGKAMNTLKTCIVLIVIGLFMLVMKKSERPAV